MSFRRIRSSSSRDLIPEGDPTVSSFRSISRKSSNPQISILGLESRSVDSSQNARKSFRPVSYQAEKRSAISNDVLNQANRLQVHYKVEIQGLVDSANTIRNSIAREKAHITTVLQENDRREKEIKETLKFLRSNSKTSNQKTKTPTMSQLKTLADSILQEALKFKARSENPHRIENEVFVSPVLYDETFIKIMSPETSGLPPEQCLEFYRVRLCNLVYSRENCRLQQETIASNRDMLKKLIFNHNTDIEDLKSKKQTLETEAKELKKEFEDLLNNYSKRLGTLMWKNDVIKSANTIASSKSPL